MPSAVRTPISRICVGKPEQRRTSIAAPRRSAGRIGARPAAVPPAPAKAVLSPASRRRPGEPRRSHRQRRAPAPAHSTTFCAATRYLATGTRTRYRRRQADREIRARPEPHFLAARGEHHTGARRAADGRALRRTVAAADQTADDRAADRAAADLRGVLLLRRRRLSRDRRRSESRLVRRLQADRAA